MATLTLKAPPKALPPLLVAARQRAEAEARAREAADAARQAEAEARQAAEAAEADRQQDELRRERRARKKQNINQTIRELRARWPDAFARPVPLAVGIREQIRAGMPDLPEPTLNMALRHWTRTLTYLAALAEGQPRRNLDGSEAGLPEDVQRDFARLLVEQRAARRPAGSGATSWRAIPPAPETPVAEPPASGQDGGIRLDADSGAGQAGGPGSQLGDGA